MPLMGFFIWISDIGKVTMSTKSCILSQICMQINFKSDIFIGVSQTF